MAIHGNKSQGARTRALAEFKEGGLRVLVATDIAARGIDIDQLPHVVNYDLPNVPEDYVHRIGRTGRAGATGEAISLVCVDEHEFLRDIERLLKRQIPEEVIAGFEPDPRARAQPILQRQGRGQSQGARRGVGPAATRACRGPWRPRPASRRVGSAWFAGRREEPACAGRLAAAARHAQRNVAARPRAEGGVGVSQRDPGPIGICNARGPRA